MSTAHPLNSAPAEALAPGATNHDLHRRRPGEPLGYVPEEGDIIKYAMRHNPWDRNGRRIPDWPSHDSQGAWTEPHIVLGVYTQDERTHYALRNRRTGERSWIDLDWWICEAVVVDGALW